MHVDDIKRYFSIYYIVRHYIYIDILKVKQHKIAKYSVMGSVLSQPP